MSSAAALVRSPLVSVLLPIFNEEEQVGRAIFGLSRLCLSRSLAHEILVIDNGSVDNTAGLLALLRRTILELRVHSLPKKIGQGSAIREGLQRALGRYVLLCGVSESLRALSQEPERPFSKAIQLLEDGYEMVINEPPSSEESNLRGFGVALVSRLKKGLDSFMGSSGAPLLFIERQRAIELSLGLRDSHGATELVSLARERRHKLAEVVHPKKPTS